MYSPEPNRQYTPSCKHLQYQHVFEINARGATPAVNEYAYDRWTNATNSSRSSTDSDDTIYNPLSGHSNSYDPATYHSNTYHSVPYPAPNTYDSVPNPAPNRYNSVPYAAPNRYNNSASHPTTNSVSNATTTRNNSMHRGYGYNTIGARAATAASHPDTGNSDTSNESTDDYGDVQAACTSSRARPNIHANSSTHNSGAPDAACTSFRAKPNSNASELYTERGRTTGTTHASAHTSNLSRNDVKMSAAKHPNHCSNEPTTPHQTSNLSRNDVQMSAVRHRNHFSNEPTTPHQTSNLSRNDVQMSAVRHRNHYSNEHTSQHQVSNLSRNEAVMSAARNSNHYSNERTTPHQAWHAAKAYANRHREHSSYNNDCDDYGGDSKTCTGNHGAPYAINETNRDQTKPPAIRRTSNDKQPAKSLKYSTSVKSLSRAGASTTRKNRGDKHHKSFGYYGYMVNNNDNEAEVKGTPPSLRVEVTASDSYSSLSSSYVNKTSHTYPMHSRLQGESSSDQGRRGGVGGGGVAYFNTNFNNSQRKKLSQSYPQQQQQQQQDDQGSENGINDESYVDLSVMVNRSTTPYDVSARKREEEMEVGAAKSRGEAHVIYGGWRSQARGRGFAGGRGGRGDVGRRGDVGERGQVGGRGVEMSVRDTMKVVLDGVEDNDSDSDLDVSGTVIHEKNASDTLINNRRTMIKHTSRNNKATALLNKKNKDTNENYKDIIPLPNQSATRVSECKMRYNEEGEFIMAKKQREDDIMAKKKREDDIIAKKRKEEDIIAKQRIKDDITARKQREDDIMARKKMEDDIMARKKREDDITSKKRKEDDIIAKQRIEDDITASKQREDDIIAKQRREDGITARKQREDDILAKQRREDDITDEKRRADDKIREQNECVIRIKKIIASVKQSYYLGNTHDSQIDKDLKEQSNNKRIEIKSSILKINENNCKITENRDKLVDINAYDTNLNEVLKYQSNPENINVNNNISQSSSEDYYNHQNHNNVINSLSVFTNKSLHSFNNLSSNITDLNTNSSNNNNQGYGRACYSKENSSGLHSKRATNEGQHTNNVPSISQSYRALELQRDRHIVANDTNLTKSNLENRNHENKSLLLNPAVNIKVNAIKQCTIETQTYEISEDNREDVELVIPYKMSKYAQTDIITSEVKKNHKNSTTNMYNERDDAWNEQSVNRRKIEEMKANNKYEDTNNNNNNNNDVYRYGVDMESRYKHGKRATKEKYSLVNKGRAARATVMKKKPNKEQRRPIEFNTTLEHSATDTIGTRSSSETSDIDDEEDTEYTDNRVTQMNREHMPTQANKYTRGHDCDTDSSSDGRRRMRKVKKRKPRKIIQKKWRNRSKANEMRTCNIPTMEFVPRSSVKKKIEHTSKSKHMNPRDKVINEYRVDVKFCGQCHNEVDRCTCTCAQQ